MFQLFGRTNMPWQLVTLITPADTIFVNGEGIKTKEIDIVRVHENGTITFEKKIAVKVLQKEGCPIGEPGVMGEPGIEPEI